jgi:hypothetical protein
MHSENIRCKNEKANLPDIVENECTHLNPTENKITTRVTHRI